MNIATDRVRDAARVAACATMVLGAGVGSVWGQVRIIEGDGRLGTNRAAFSDCVVVGIALEEIGGLRDEALIDDDPASGLRLKPTAEAAVELRFRGVPRWVNRVRVESNTYVVVDWIDADGSRVALADGRPIRPGEFVECVPLRARGVRVTLPADRLPAEWTLTGVFADFHAIDPDALGGRGTAVLQVFTEWIRDYSNYPIPPEGRQFADLDYSNLDARNFGSGLEDRGWFWTTYGANNCAAGDWRSATARPPGNENQYPDDSDFAYFSGHGNDGELVFNTKQPDFMFNAPQAQSSYGDRELEWITLQACKAFANLGRKQFYRTLNGAHSIMGWESSTPDIAYGGLMQRLLHPGFIRSAYTIQQAFYRSTIFWCDVTRANAIMAEDLGPPSPGALCDEFIHGVGPTLADPTPAGSMHYAYHRKFFSQQRAEAPGPVRRFPATAPDGIAVEVPEALLSARAGRGVMTRYDLLPVTVTPTTVAQQATDLCNSIGLLCGATVGNDPDLGSVNAASGTWELIVDSDSSSLDLIQPTRWAVSEATAPTLPSDTAAPLIAASFLNTSGLMPAGAEFDDVSHFGQEGYTEVGSDFVPNPSRFYKTAVNAWFRRHLPEPGNAPVAGPGGRLFVTIGDADEIHMVGRGAWRPVSNPTSVDVASLSEVIGWLNALGVRAATVGVQGRIRSIMINSAMLGYYDYGDWAPSPARDRLRPAYILDVTFGFGPGEPSETGELCVFIDAPPLEVTINAPVIEAEWPASTGLNFSGSASGGTPPYAYSWSSEYATGPSGVGAAVSLTSAAGPEAGQRQCRHVISLSVTDANGESATANVTLRNTVVPVCPCIEILPGDSNLDGFVSVGDIRSFVDALTGGFSEWDAGLPGVQTNTQCTCANDTNLDGTVTFDDISGFVQLLVGSDPMLGRGGTVDVCPCS